MLACSAFVMTVLLMPGISSGETATAPLNGSVSFTTASAAQDTLKVNAGTKTIKAIGCWKVYGDPDSEITEVTTPGTGIVTVATVVHRAGNSLYVVWGSQSGGSGAGSGAGDGPDQWISDYERDNSADPRILLEVNGGGTDDDVIKYGENGGTLRVSLANGEKEKAYTITLSDSGAGDVDFSSASLTLFGPYASNTIDLDGEEVGSVTISASCDDAQDGEIDAVVSSIQLLTKRVDDSGWQEEDTAIAAGAIDSAAHKADVRIVGLDPQRSVDVKLIGGSGHTSANDAKLIFGEVTIGPGETQSLTPDQNGELNGTLTSSDVLDGATIEVTDSGVSSTASTYVAFEWDNYQGDDGWVSTPEYISPDSSCDQTLILMHEGSPLNGHLIEFYVEEVQYEDEYGYVVTLTNTPENPSDLSSWASFETSQGYTDSYGEVTVALNIEDKPEILSVTLGAYDLTVWEE